jgi:hypothetical protein
VERASTASGARRTFRHPVAKPRSNDLPPDVPLPSAAGLPPENYGIWYRSDRPRVVGIIGWVCAAIGYGAFVLKAPQLLIYFWPSILKSVNADWVPMQLSRGQFAASVFILLAELALALFTIAAGLGALKMKEWGRRSLVWYALLAAVLTVIKTGWQIFMFDTMLDYHATTTTQPFDRQTAGNAQFVVLLIMAAVQLLWAAMVASLMTRMYVKEAYAKAEAARSGHNDWRST